MVKLNTNDFGFGIECKQHWILNWIKEKEGNIFFKIECEWILFWNSMQTTLVLKVNTNDLGSRSECKQRWLMNKIQTTLVLKLKEPT